MAGLTTNYTAADLVTSLGAVPLGRLGTSPPPGTATVEDAVHRTQAADGDGLWELYDGTLVRKPMGWFESLLAVRIAAAFQVFVEHHDLGIVLGEQGMLRVEPDQLRMPDVSFIAKDRLDEQFAPDVPAPLICPDLAVEILSPSNTAEEMNRKIREYFAGGTIAVWIVDAAAKNVRVYSRPDKFAEISQGILRGDPVLPGFELELTKLFRSPVS